MKPVFYRLIHLRRRTFEMSKTVNATVEKKITPKYNLSGKAALKVPAQVVGVTRYNASNNLVMPTFTPFNNLCLALERSDIDYKALQKHDIYIENEEGEEVKHNLADYVQELDKQFLDKSGKVWNFPVTSNVRLNQISFKIDPVAAQFIDLAGLSSDTPEEENQPKKKQSAYVRGSIKLHKAS